MLWAALAAALILLLLLFRSCDAEDEHVDPVATAPAAGAATTAAPVDGVAFTGMYGELDRYLASSEAAGRRFTFDNLHFATNSAALPADAQTTLAGLSQILARRPNAQVQIVGYADARGGEGANAQLGAQRAQAVAQALGAMGVAAGRISTGTGSEADPVASNATQQGQAENRRTELVVTAK